LEEFLSLRVRSAWFAALLLAALFGVMRPLSAAQDQASQSQASPTPVSQTPASQNQSTPDPNSQNQPQSTPPQQPVPQSPDSTKPAQPDKNTPDANPANPAAESSSVQTRQENQEPPATPTQPQPANQAPNQKQSSSRQPAPKAPPKPSASNDANQIPITLDTSETIFSVLTALNACGYDQDLAISEPTRTRVRAEVERNIRSSGDAQAAQSQVCDFIDRHVASRDSNRNLSQYISLALYMDGAPHFMPRTKEEDLPPDAGAIAGLGTLLEKFYDKAGIHGIWERHRFEYLAAVRRYHEPLAKMVFDTEVYLKQPSAQYLGRTFTVYLDFMGSPNETDARNYGTAYYVVVFPSPVAAGSSVETGLKMDQIRHTFLHYELDPLADKHYTAIKRLQPLLQSVKRAPLEESFKSDISLLVTECLVRAIEIRTSGSKAEEAMRAQAVDDAVKQGYILTRHFYNAIVAFEKDPAGISGEYAGILDAVDIKKEEKAATEVQFASAAAPELVRLSRPEERRLLITAEKRLSAGDPKGAQELAQAALDKKIGDQGRALFILAEVAVANKNRDGAEDNFHKAIEASNDPKVVGWSHVYLGRILDMKEDRDAAVEQYRAALTAGATLPEVKAAAERGLAQAYEPPTKPQPQPQ
jgi:tetratricopeptide (TPR) repeat protein/outer membrane biosynthesis protein TonB